LPALIGTDRSLARQLLAVHQAVGFSLLALIALHASAALYHHFWRRDDALDAMLPRPLRRCATAARSRKLPVPRHASRDAGL
jgi:cytochrome b561